jgi:hypothetical protein
MANPMSLKRFAWPLAGLGVLAVAGACANGSPSNPFASIPQYPQRHVCGDAAPGYNRCFADIRTDAAGQETSSPTPRGLGPSDLQAAYKFGTSGTGTIAVVDAFDDPTAESDLAVYRTQYGLSPCTSASGCFTKVNQGGASSPLPAANPAWQREIALDLAAVSAGCPSCRIILIEASSGSDGDLAAAAAQGASMGASAISLSYGRPEQAGDSSLDANYAHGVPVFAASGDRGYGVNYPAASGQVVAVGGTTLVQDSSSRGWAEQAWSKGSSGCSQFAAKPAWQNDPCTHRTVADIAAVADTNTGIAVYVAGGWKVIGGTSLAAPLTAALLVNSGRLGSGYPYNNGSYFFDIQSGSNGSCGNGASAYLCSAQPGYDAPTGIGTPAMDGSGNGTGYEGPEGGVATERPDGGAGGGEGGPETVGDDGGGTADSGLDDGGDTYDGGSVDGGGDDDAGSYDGGATGDSGS